jgi:hypothetical protein
MTCRACFKSKTTIVAGRTYFNCAGTADQGCLMHGETGLCELCNVETHHTKADGTGCLPFSDSLKKPTNTTQCVYTFTTTSDTAVDCLACRGDFRPVQGNLPGVAPSCVAVNTGAGKIEGCGFYAHNGACYACTGDRLKHTDGTCIPWTAVTKGCHDTMCDSCNFLLSYY